MNNKKNLFCLLLCVVVLTITMGYLLGRHYAKPKPVAAAVDTIPVLATRIAECSKLYTSEYELHKIILYDDPAAISGQFLNHDIHINLPLGKRRIAIPVKATAMAYVDMGQLTPANIHRHGDRIEIVLPDPQVTLTATSIDHQGISQQVSLLRSRFSDDEITAIQQRGRQDIIKSLASTDILEDARLSAARQLIPIVSRMGFKEENITITFRKGLTVEKILNPTIQRTKN